MTHSIDKILRVGSLIVIVACGLVLMTHDYKGRSSNTDNERLYDTIIG